MTEEESLARAERCHAHKHLGTDSHYFELESAHVGDRFAIWAMMPPSYARRTDRAFPVIYVTDGNTNAVIATAAASLLLGDHLRPTRPFIQICIGYADDDVGRRFVRRNRDFIPPGEPFSPMTERHIGARAYANALGIQGQEEFLAYARNGRADRFLGFLEQELHPEIVRRYRVDSAPIGLFGHSQGGLFTLYALTGGSSHFGIFGAASPAMLTAESQVMARYRQRLVDVGIASGGNQERLHLVASELEMTGTIELYRAIGRGYLSFVDVIRGEPWPGLLMTSAIIPGETHFSGVFDAYRSFLRSCYASPAAAEQV